MGNFTFLESHWTDLAKLGDLSEKYVYSDPNTSIIKQGMLAEIMVKYMLAYDGIAEPEYDNTHANRIRLLKQNDLLPYEVKNTLYILRKDRNDAAHNGTEEGDRALSNLHLLYDLCVWYMQTYGDYNFNPEPYQDPVDYVVNVDELEKENKELEERNKALLIELQTIQKQGKADSNRRAVAYSKAMALKLTEAQTRELIDEQLRKCGWEADTTEIRYSKGTRPIKGKNLAIAEWPTDSKVGNHGYADYALFIGEKLVGIIEAKKKHTDISSVLDGQCKDYAKMIKSEHQKYVINRFGAYMAPFLYATNKLEQAIVPVEEQPYEVPENWCWTYLGQVADWGSGGTPSRKHPEYYGGSIPWIKTGELNDGYIYDSEEKITEEAIQHSSAKIFPKDTVAIAMYGATIGKVGIFGMILIISLYMT